MKKSALILIILLLLHRSFGQDSRVLQGDKSKVFITTIKSNDNVLQVVVLNADWRLDYVQKNSPDHIALDENGDPDSISRTRHRLFHSVASASEHHGAVQMTHSFYVDISNTKNMNGILRMINEEYRNVMHIDDEFNLISNFLPDSNAEYYVYGYKGKTSASLEVLYLWGAPLKDWSVGCSLSIHNRQAKMVLNSIMCMGPDDTELKVRKIKARQSNLLDVMTDSDMFCP